MSLLLEEISEDSRWPLVVVSQPDVVALPYITPQMLRTTAADTDAAPEAQIAGLAGQLALYSERLYASVNADRPAIFAGHLLIRGAGVVTDQEIEHGYRQELWLDPANLAHFTSYNALGHIHLSQEIKGASKPTWYSGAPDRLNRGEREYTPCVLLVQTPDRPGGIADVTRIPLTTCTPFVDVELNGQEAVDRFLESVGTPDPLGKATIRAIPVAARRGRTADTHDSPAREYPLAAGVRQAAGTIRRETQPARCPWNDHRLPQPGIRRSAGAAGLVTRRV